VSGEWKNLCHHLKIINLNGLAFKEPSIMENEKAKNRRDNSRWSKAGENLRDGINLSPKQFHSSSLSNKSRKVEDTKLRETS
jgi:hypothetical protein